MELFGCLYQSALIPTLIVFVFQRIYFQLVVIEQTSLQSLLTFFHITCTSSQIESLQFSIFMALWHILIYITVNGFFGICDYYSLLSEYKFQRKSHAQPKPSLIIKTLLEASLTSFIFLPIGMYFFHPYFQYFGTTAMSSPLPSFSTVFTTCAIAYQLNSTLFYFSHRLLHHKWLYSMIHKQHHEYHSSIGIAAEYAHPLESILSNIIPTMLGVFLLGAHPWVILICITSRLQQTYETHSGYCFNNTWMDRLGLAHGDGCAFHDFHHSVNTGNYGVSPLLDYVCGTLGDSYVKGGYHTGYIEKMVKIKA